MSLYMLVFVFRGNHKVDTLNYNLKFPCNVRAVKYFIQSVFKGTLLNRNTWTFSDIVFFKALYKYHRFMVIIHPCEIYRFSAILHRIPSMPNRHSSFKNWSNPSYSVKIGTPCWSLWHNYPMNTKHHQVKRGLGSEKLPLRKCLMGVVTPTLYHGCVPLSGDEQGKGRTNG